MTQPKRRKAGYGALQSARSRQKRLRLILIVVPLVIIAVAAAVTTHVVRDNIRERDAAIALETEVRQYETTFEPSVTINGESLTGYTYEEAKSALDEKYASTLGNVITLTCGDKTWRFTPRDMGASIDTAEQLETAWNYGKNGTLEERLEEIRALNENPVDLKVTLTYDRDQLMVFAQHIKEEIDTEPVNATMQIVEVAKFAYTDSSPGASLDAEALVNQLEDMIRNGDEGPLEIVPEVIEPDVTREQLEHKTVLLGECYTSLEGSSSSRAHNVSLALSYFNFMTVEPGQKVSFNKVVGKRTELNGFKEAPEYAGTVIQMGIGGGSCQASTTVYGAVIRAGLEILERHKHTMTVGYVPGSQDAAVNDNDKDMRFRNTTENTLYIFAYVDNNRNMAVCKIFGQPIDPTVYIQIESVILQADIAGSGISYMDDEDGKQVWYVDDPPVLYKVGKKGMRSEAYRIYYDLTTGAEVRREKLSQDYYMPENDTYLRGVHER